jgi:hypothetical protein
MSRDLAVEKKHLQSDLNNALYHMSDSDIVAWLQARPNEKERLRVCAIIADEDNEQAQVTQENVKPEA